MGRPFTVTLEGEHIFVCQACQTQYTLLQYFLPHESFYNPVTMVGYQVLSEVVNTFTDGKIIELKISDAVSLPCMEIFCVGCAALLGLKIESVPDIIKHKIKEGKYIFIT
ncbi:uncharacterized protein LOC133802465 [Humulus lupulus]|uniref:uncharacterized protein LOC133802465 n=1 Tax=Humulus lupulus TaxID=3486 RepID=UPI002B417E5F|nr:uncharacterized protein LOC133802465 [Humulus lupulus]